MFATLVPSLEGAGCLRCSSSKPAGCILRSHSAPALTFIRSGRSRRLAVPRAQLEYVETLESTKDENHVNGDGRNGVSRAAEQSLVIKYGEVTDLVDAASKFKAFLLEGGGHLPPGSLTDGHLWLFMDFYNNYQSRHPGLGVEGPAVIGRDTWRTGV